MKLRRNAVPTEAFQPDGVVAIGGRITTLNGELKPADILTPEQLAARLQVSKSWVFEQTRRRTKIRNSNPLPCIRLGKYLRFSWTAVCEWMQNNG